jgi:Flp pilus assembly pilin Flp
MNNNPGNTPKRNRREKGVTTVEYVIMLVLIAIAVAIGAPYVSSSIVGVFSKTSSVLGR